MYLATEKTWQSAVFKIMNLCNFFSPFLVVTKLLISQYLKAWESDETTLQKDKKKRVAPRFDEFFFLSQFHNERNNQICSKIYEVFLPFKDLLILSCNFCQVMIICMTIFLDILDYYSFSIFNFWALEIPIGSKFG